MLIQDAGDDRVVLLHDLPLGKRPRAELERTSHPVEDDAPVHAACSRSTCSRIAAATSRLTERFPSSARRRICSASSTEMFAVSGTFFVHSVFIETPIGGYEASERNSFRSASTCSPMSFAGTPVAAEKPSGCSRRRRARRSSASAPCRCRGGTARVRARPARAGSCCFSSSTSSETISRTAWRGL